MPNTLVHLGVQSVSTKLLFRAADFKWIAVGCIIPDVPWIFQRIILAAGLSVDRLDLFQYAAVQASLFATLFLCGALALLAAESVRIYLILAGNALLHLLLDGLQIKWANGVHFFAPFSWNLVSFDLLWPEHPLVLFFTAAGLGALFFYGARDWQKVIRLTGKRRKIYFAALLLAAYFAVPLLFLSAPHQADNYFIATLRNREERAGKYLELDRARYRADDATIEIFTGERLRATGNKPLEDGIVSIRGYFSDSTTLHISALHVHSPMRDIYSKIALAGVASLWLAALLAKKVKICRGEQNHNGGAHA